MKKILALIAATVCAASMLYAQGTVNFDSSLVGAAAKVTEAAGFSGAGAAIGNTVAGTVSANQYLMQLYALAGSVGDSTSLLPVGSPVNARGGTANSGYNQMSGTTTLGLIFPTTITTTVTIPTPSGGGQVTLQLRAWWAGPTGTTYQSYYDGTWAGTANASMRYGFSPLLVLNSTGNPLAVPAGTPVNMIGLTGFQLVPVPEPTTFALLGLGALGMMIFRRK